MNPAKAVDETTRPSIPVISDWCSQRSRSAPFKLDWKHLATVHPIEIQLL